MMFILSKEFYQYTFKRSDHTSFGIYKTFCTNVYNFFLISKKQWTLKKIKFEN